MMRTTLPSHNTVLISDSIWYEKENNMKYDISIKINTKSTFELIQYKSYKSSEINTQKLS